jgi:hypothetical protein
VSNHEETKKKIAELTEDLLYFSNMCDHLTKTIGILNANLDRLKINIKQIKDESLLEKK